MAGWDSLFSYNNTKTIFTCSKCKKESPVQYSEQLKLIACHHCHTIHSRDYLVKYLELKNNFIKDKHGLALNETGLYNEEIFKIIGIANKRENKRSGAPWREHVLLGKDNKISFLNECFGHYTWMTQKSDIPIHNINEFIKNGIDYEGRNYRFFSKYSYTTLNCTGEFAYNVVDVKNINCYDFISPPYAISLEVHPDGRREGFHGFHITRHKVHSIFSNTDILWKTREGVGMAQPFFFGIDIRIFKRAMLLFLAFLCISSIAVYNLEGRRQSLLGSSFDTDMTVSGKDFISESFTLPEKTTPYYLNFNAHAGVMNEWVDMALTLVNETTGEEREFGLTIEQYSGISNGYSWSEGSTTGEVNLSAVPPGRYHIKCKLFNSCSEMTTVTLSCSTSSPIMWNSLFIIISLAIFTFLLNRLSIQFERRRSGEIDNLLGMTEY